MNIAGIGFFHVTLLCCGLLAIEAENSKNCAELKLKGDSQSGVRKVFPVEGFAIYSVDVFCDQRTDGGGWTLIQNRDVFPVRENFVRTWNEYAVGFGNLTGEFWLGLENLHALTTSAQMELRVDLEDWEGEKRWAKYGTFHVGDSSTDYVLKIGDYSGDAGDSFTPDDAVVNFNGMKFSTFDSDNDLKPDGNCAEEFKAGFWFNNCHWANVNGFPYAGKHESNADGINWLTFHGHSYSLKKVSMKIRPVAVDWTKIIEPRVKP